MSTKIRYVKYDHWRSRNQLRLIMATLLVSTAMYTIAALNLFNDESSIFWFTGIAFVVVHTIGMYLAYPSGRWSKSRRHQTRALYRTYILLLILIAVLVI